MTKKTCWSVTLITAFFSTRPALLTKGEGSSVCAVLCPECLLMLVCGLTGQDMHTFQTEALKAHGVTEEKNSLYFSETVTIRSF